MLKMTLFFTFALILAFLPASPAAARDNASERGPAVLERLVGSYERGRHTAKYALSLHAEHGVEALLAQAERDLKAASLPPKRAAGTAHEPYAARAWFCGVLAAVKSDPARESGRPGAPDAAVSRAAAYFQLTETDRLRLFDRTREILATAEKRMAGERELRMVCRLRYGPGKKTLTMRRESSITVPVPSGDAAILLRECTEGTFYCTVDYIADEDGDFKRVKAARPARKSD